MSRLVVLAFKDLKLITRDKLGMFFMLAFPILMALFFGSIMGGFGESGSRSLKVVVTDLDKSKISKQFVDSLKQNESVDVTEMERDAAMNSVRRGQHVGVIIVPEDFGRTAGMLNPVGDSMTTGESSPAITAGTTRPAMNYARHITRTFVVSLQARPSEMSTNWSR